MILHNHKCSKCEKVFERMVNWDETEQTCECGAKAQRIFITGRHYNAQRFDPVLVFRDASGNYKFPGRNKSRAPKGYEPLYLRSIPEIRKFEKEINHKEYVRHLDKQEREERCIEPFRKRLREQLRGYAQNFSEYGRDFARTAMEENNNRRKGRFDAGFHIEAFSNDAGSRDEWTDRDTGMKGRK